MEQTRARPDGSSGEGSRMTQLKSGSGCGISGWDYPDYPRVCPIEERQKGGLSLRPACIVSGCSQHPGKLVAAQKRQRDLSGLEPARAQEVDLVVTSKGLQAGHSDGQFMYIEWHRYYCSILQRRIRRNREICRFS